MKKEKRTTDRHGWTRICEVLFTKTRVIFTELFGCFDLSFTGPIPHGSLKKQHKTSVFICVHPWFFACPGSSSLSIRDSDQRFFYPCMIPRICVV